MCILIVIRIREVLQADMPEIAVTQCHATMSIPGMYFKVTLWHHIMLPPPQAWFLFLLFHGAAKKGRLPTTVGHCVSLFVMFITEP